MTKQTKEDLIMSIFIITVVMVLLVTSSLLFINLQREKMEKAYYKTQMILFCEWVVDMNKLDNLPIENITPCERWFIGEE